VRNVGFDETVSKKGFRLVRYADDFLILCRKKPQAERALQVVDALLQDLELQLERSKTQITNFEEGFDFLGATFVKSLVFPPVAKEKKRSSRKGGKVPEGPVTSLPAKRADTLPHPFLRTLYLQKQGSVLSKEGDRFVIAMRGETQLEIPVIKIEQIVVFGNAHLTTPALHLCADYCECISVELTSGGGLAGG